MGRRVKKAELAEQLWAAEKANYSLQLKLDAALDELDDRQMVRRSDLYHCVDVIANLAARLTEIRALWKTCTKPVPDDDELAVLKGMMVLTLARPIAPMDQAMEDAAIENAEDEPRVEAEGTDA